MSKFSITVDDKNLRIAISGMEKAAKDLKKPLRKIAEQLKRSVKDNFGAGGRYSQAGSMMGGESKWLPLKHQRLTRTGKVSAKQSPLIKSGGLKNTIYAKVMGNSIEIGSPKKYAAIHQFGGKTRPHEIRARNGKALKFFPGGAGSQPVLRKAVKHPGSVIPARPFLVIQQSDMDYIKARLLYHLTGEIKTV